MHLTEACKYGVLIQVQQLRTYLRYHSTGLKKAACFQECKRVSQCNQRAMGASVCRTGHVKELELALYLTYKTGSLGKYKKAVRCGVVTLNCACYPMQMELLCKCWTAQ